MERCAAAVTVLEDAFDAIRTVVDMATASATDPRGA